MQTIGKSKIYRPADTIELQKHGLKHGKVKGTTTYNLNMDECWRWRKKEANLWTGYANEGKSLYFRQVALIKALEEGWKFLFAAPEDFPPEEFFDDLIHTIAGQTTDPDYTNVISDAVYDKAHELIKDNFIFVYTDPPHNTIKQVLDDFRLIMKGEKIDGCVIDPAMKFARPKHLSDRDDLYASYVGSLCMDFCRTTDTSTHVILHQLTPVIDSVSKKYLEPSMYRIKGGGSWADGFDNVLSVWRPHYAIDKFNTEVQFSSQKIKKQKLVGIPQKMTVEFNRKTNRYCAPNTEGKVPLFDFDKFIYPKSRLARVS